ncbi:MAG: Sir2 family NAD-dependent protein deacetylase [Acidobacteriota bacterium]|nr:Sir2 family NAD-dependent protein deacetylase [Acidobacteriota bacterium]
MSEAVDILHRAFEEVGSGLLLVVTGAGVSVASGIPTFRGDDPGAIWKRDVTELGTYAYFREDPVGSWRWYLSRFERVLGAEPNDAHRALAALERWQVARGGDFLLVTQNIDTLHEDAGSQRLVKVHGTADRVRCATDGCRLGAPGGSIPRSEIDLGPFLEKPAAEHLPRCPQCGDVLRQHVLWFDEYYQGHSDYQFSRVQQALERMALVLFVGTSFSVGVTEMALRSGILWKTPMYSIDPSATVRMNRLTSLDAQAETLLPQVCEALGAELGSPW